MSDKPGIFEKGRARLNAFVSGHTVAIYLFQYRDESTRMCSVCRDAGRTLAWESGNLALTGWYMFCIRFRAFWVFPSLNNAFKVVYRTGLHGSTECTSSCGASPTSASTADNAISIRSIRTAWTATAWLDVSSQKTWLHDHCCVISFVPFISTLSTVCPRLENFVLWQQGLQVVPCSGYISHTKHLAQVEFTMRSSPREWRTDSIIEWQASPSLRNRNTVRTIQGHTVLSCQCIPNIRLGQSLLVNEMLPTTRRWFTTTCVSHVSNFWGVTWESGGGFLKFVKTM